MRVVYRFALDPPPGQVRALVSHCGAVRVAYNCGLARVEAVMDQRAAERSYGIAEADLTPAAEWTLPALRRAWNQAKAEVAPWWADNSKEAYNTGLDALARTLKNWTESRTGKRVGPPVGFPRFKSRRTAGMWCRFTTGVIRVKADRGHVSLLRLGMIKTHESTRKLARRLEAGTARILPATVRREAGRWFVSFTCEVDRVERLPERPQASIGVDLGVTHLAVLSTGTTMPNPRHLSTASRKMRRLARAVSRKVGPYDPVTRGRRPASHRWMRATGALASAHRGVADLRRDGIHQLTTTDVEPTARPAAAGRWL